MSTRVRCAIYTRKSSEEGLEQSFNSLDAQREACAAYILSQASEGWVEIADSYDDGGLSGGTLERPALQRLLADVASGRIDIIVVYKVDRLTRSLLDFAPAGDVPTQTVRSAPRAAPDRTKSSYALIASLHRARDTALGQGDEQTLPPLITA